MNISFISCPFCGNDKIGVKTEIIEHRAGQDCPCSSIRKVWAYCKYCEATGPKHTIDMVYPSEAEAMACEAWNRRFSDIVKPNDSI